MSIREPNATNLKDSEKIVYKTGSFLTDEDGMYYINYQHICLSDSSKFLDKLNETIEILKSEDKEYFTIFEIDCAQVHFKKGEYSYVDLDLSRIPEGLNARFDVYFWSKSGGIDLKPGARYPYIYTSEGYETPKSTYSRWVEKPTNFILRSANLNKQVPLGIQLGDDLDSDINLFNRVEFQETNLYYIVTLLQDDSLYRDRGHFFIDESIRHQDARLYQFRRPAFGDFKHLSTVARIIVSINKKELINKCSDLSEKINLARGAIEAEEKYSLVIENLIKASSNQNQNIYIYYFYETEQTLGKVISFIENNSDNYGPEAQILLEDLKAISVLKRNPCVTGWNIDKIRSNTSQFRNLLQTCKNLSQIGTIDSLILDELAKKIESNSTPQIPQTILTNLKQLKSEHETKRVNLQEFKTDLSEVMSLLNGDAKEVCETAAGSNKSAVSYNSSKRLN